jgi:hypothetical protein
MIEAINLVSFPNEFQNLEERLEAIFGETLTKKVFEPILYKYFKTSLCELAPDAYKYFGPKRIIGFNPEGTKELKKSSVYDSKFAFHSFTDGISPLRTFYPHRGGTGAWIKSLEETLNQQNVQILSNNSIQFIEYENRQIKNVILEDSSKIACDYLVWTLPSFMFIKASNLKVNYKLHPPKRLFTSLFHFIIDKPYLTDLHYLQCFDTKYKTFRVTLYGNFTGDEQIEYPLTVELLSDEILNQPQEVVLRELINMEIIHPLSQITYSHHTFIKGGFPIPTNQFIADSNYQNELVKQNFDNILLLGKATGKSFFMNEVLQETFQCINTLVGPTLTDAQ